MPHFVYDYPLAELPTNKTNLIPIPIGGDPDQYLTAEEWNATAQAVEDLRNGILNSKFYGFVAQVTDPLPTSIGTYLWIKTDKTAVLRHADTTQNKFALLDYTAAPADGEALIWNSLTSLWEPGSVGASAAEFDSIATAAYSAPIIENPGIVSSAILGSDADGFLTVTVTTIAAGTGRVFVPISTSYWTPTADKTLQVSSTIVPGGQGSRVGLAFRFQSFASGLYIVDWDPVTTGAASLRRNTTGVYSSLSANPGSIPTLGGAVASRFKTLIGGGVGNALFYGENNVIDTIRESGAAITATGQWGLFLETQGAGAGATVFKFQRVAGYPASVDGAIPGGIGPAGGDLSGSYPNPSVQKLKTTGTSVDVGLAAPPTVGQVLTASSPTTAIWQTPSGGGSVLEASPSDIVQLWVGKLGSDVNAGTSISLPKLTIQAAINATTASSSILYIIHIGPGEYVEELTFPLGFERHVMLLGALPAGVPENESEGPFNLKWPVRLKAPSMTQAAIKLGDNLHRIECINLDIECVGQTAGSVIQTRSGSSTTVGTPFKIYPTGALRFATVSHPSATFTTESVGRVLVMSGFANSSNNGEFYILKYVSATTVLVSFRTPGGPVAETGTGGASFVEKNVTSLLNLEGGGRLALRNCRILGKDTGGTQGQNTASNPHETVMTIGWSVTSGADLRMISCSGYGGAFDMIGRTVGAGSRTDFERSRFDALTILVSGNSFIGACEWSIIAEGWFCGTSTLGGVKGTGFSHLQMDSTTTLWGGLPSLSWGWLQSFGTISKGYVEPTLLSTQSGTTYTFQATDMGTAVQFTSGSPVTATVPPNSSVIMPVGARIDIVQQGAGKVTVAQGAGVTINSKGGNKSTGAQYVGISLIKTATDTWTLFGDLIA